jgi:hypothetical protein
MQGGATQAMRDIVEEHQRSRCPCAAGTLRAHRGCGQSLRCSSSTMSRIDSSSRLELASQALWARPIVLLPRAARNAYLARLREERYEAFRDLLIRINFRLLHIQAVLLEACRSERSRADCLYHEDRFEISQYGMSASSENPDSGATQRCRGQALWSVFGLQAAGVLRERL